MLVGVLAVSVFLLFFFLAFPRQAFELDPSALYEVHHQVLLALTRRVEHQVMRPLRIHDRRVQCVDQLRSHWWG